MSTASMNKARLYQDYAYYELYDGEGGVCDQREGEQANRPLTRKWCVRVAVQMRLAPVRMTRTRRVNICERHTLGVVMNVDICLTVLHS